MLVLLIGLNLLKDRAKKDYVESDAYYRELLSALLTAVACEYDATKYYYDQIDLQVRNSQLVLC